jgi:hypothetical protein
MREPRFLSASVGIPFTNTIAMRSANHKQRHPSLPDFVNKILSESATLKAETATTTQSRPPAGLVLIATLLLRRNRNHLVSRHRAEEMLSVSIFGPAGARKKPRKFSRANYLVKNLLNANCPQGVEHFQHREAQAGFFTKFFLSFLYCQGRERETQTLVGFSMLKLRPDSLSLTSTCCVNL